MNMQIPSGLQALMQASQILQQQAAPTAPGPQGQQPTVASQVQQAAAQQAQQAQPSMQQVGQQAGIAGQLMAQRAQQAQDPQAVAQMAAQMLQQRGVASLPANMQFKEGGIIGYAGPEGSQVSTQPIPDRESPPFASDLEAKARREIAEMESGERVNLSPDVEVFMSRAKPVERGYVPSEYAAQERARMTAASQEMAQPYTRLSQEYVPYPKRGEMRVTDSKPEPSGIAAIAKDEAPPPPKVAAPPATPSIPTVQPQQFERPDLNRIRAAVAPDEEARTLIGSLQAQGNAIVEARKKQEDLESQGIAALQRSEAERQRLLESRRSRDSFNSLMALARDLRTRGNEYGATQAAIEARDEANRIAGLAHEESVLKLKQAKQAREIGDMEKARTLTAEALQNRRTERDQMEKVAKANADFSLELYKSDVTAATHAADRANQVNIALANLKQRAEEQNDVKLSNQLNAAGSQLASARQKMESILQKEFGTYLQMRNLPGSKPDPEQERRYQNKVQELTNQMIAPLEAQVNALSTKVLGTPVTAARPATAAPAMKFDSSGKRIQ